MPAYFPGFRKRVLVSAAYTVLEDDDWIKADAAGGAFEIAMPDATLNPNRRLTVTRINAGANQPVLRGFGAQTINGSATAALASQWASAVLGSDGDNWIITG